jgi:hypothetical protein
LQRAHLPLLLQRCARFRLSVRVKIGLVVARACSRVCASEQILHAVSDLSCDVCC